MEYDQEEAQWSKQEEVPPSEQEEVPPSEQEEEEEASSSISLRPPSTNDTYLTLSALLKAVNQHGKDQGYAVVKRRTKQKKGGYSRCLPLVGYGRKTSRTPASLRLKKKP